MFAIKLGLKSSINKARGTFSCHFHRSIFSIYVTCPMFTRLRVMFLSKDKIKILKIALGLIKTNTYPPVCHRCQRDESIDLEEPLLVQYLH